MTTKTQEREQDRAAAHRDLMRMFPPGSTATTLLRHVSSSGMTRWISVIHEDRDISWMVARALGKKVDGRHGGIKVNGCGMDMGFDLVYRLSLKLWGPGYACIGEGCPSNLHCNDRAAGYGQHHTDGYAISQRWL